MAGMEAIPAAREKMVAGWTWIPVESLLFFFPLSSWDVISICPAQLSFLLVRLLPPSFFFLEGTSGEWA